MVAMFLHILAHDVKNRVIQRKFMRSGETIFHHFNMVLLAVIRLHDELLKKPQHNCLGALDGMYIKVNIPASDGARYRTRKGEVATNVHGLCDTKGDFAYILASYYYLVDVGYLNAEGFLAPYRGQRYHLQKWRGAENAPSTSKEFFNMKLICLHLISSMTSSTKLPKHNWIKEKEANLIECLVELVNAGG
uniref:DUF8040 domain-containing protein n=1 Tax=Cucumis melo TaxID=3656 RepID=A0A9I9ELZ5_CUCME